MQTGKVKFYNKSKRYGFISSEDGNDYFFHESGLTEGIYVREGDKVELRLLMAIVVKRLLKSLLLIKEFESILK